MENRLQRASQPQACNPLSFQTYTSLESAAQENGIAMRLTLCHACHMLATSTLTACTRAGALVAARHILAGAALAGAVAAQVGRKSTLKFQYIGLGPTPSREAGRTCSCPARPGRRSGRRCSRAQGRPRPFSCNLRHCQQNLEMGGALVAARHVLAGAAVAGAVAAQVGRVQRLALVDVEAAQLAVLGDLRHVPRPAHALVPVERVLALGLAVPARARMSKQIINKV